MINKAQQAISKEMPEWKYLAATRIRVLAAAFFDPRIGA